MTKVSAKRIRNIMAAVGVGLLLLIVGTEDFYVNELGIPAPIKWRQLIVALVFVAPWCINFGYKLYRCGRENR